MGAVYSFAGYSPISLGFVVLEWHKILKCVPNGLKALSCGWALYCLTLFAHELYSAIPQMRLFLKFISIKGIVFFTFWQAFMISLVSKLGFIEQFSQWISTHSDLEKSWWSMDQIKSGINDFLLCIECFVFCILHWFAYPATEWSEHSKFKHSSSFFMKVQETTLQEPLHMALEAIQLMDIRDMYRQVRILRARGDEQRLEALDLNSYPKAHTTQHEATRSEMLERLHRSKTSPSV